MKQSKPKSSLSAKNKRGKRKSGYDSPWKVSLALLTDFDSQWRPGTYVRELAGCELTFRFPVKKLMDYNTEELASSRNPFAFIA